MKVFKAFRPDTNNHWLWCREQRAPLSPKAFDTLRYSVEHADRPVTQQQILEAVAGKSKPRVAAAEEELRWRPPVHR